MLSLLSGSQQHPKFSARIEITTEGDGTATAAKDLLARTAQKSGIPLIIGDSRDGFYCWTGNDALNKDVRPEQLISRQAQEKATTISLLCQQTLKQIQDELSALAAYVKANGSADQFFPRPDYFDFTELMRAYNTFSALDLGKLPQFLNSGDPNGYTPSEWKTYPASTISRALERGNFDFKTGNIIA